MVECSPGFGFSVPRRECQDYAGPTETAGPQVNPQTPQQFGLNSLTCHLVVGSDNLNLDFITLEQECWGAGLAEQLPINYVSGIREQDLEF